MSQDTARPLPEPAGVPPVPCIEDICQQMEAVGKRVEALRKELYALDRVASGDERGRLVDAFESASADREHLELLDHLQSIGWFICEYGQPALWKALWCRYATDRAAPDGWTIRDGYREHDELRFVYGAGQWQEALARLSAPAASA